MLMAIFYTMLNIQFQQYFLLKDENCQKEIELKKVLREKYTKKKEVKQLQHLLDMKHLILKMDHQNF